MTSEKSSLHQQADLITIDFTPTGAYEGDLPEYLEEKLQVRVAIDLAESADFQTTALYLAPVAVPLTVYAGRKLIDVLAHLLREWLQERPQIPEIVLYDANGNIIKKVSRK
jgi:hypothetical protein